MKGIVLAGGKGNRLRPLTEVTNKHLLPIYNQPMIYYPINTLRKAGIDDILIISGPHHAGSFLQLLGDGRSFKCTFNFRVQEKAAGIADALYLAKDFVQDDNCAVILGDNIFEDNLSKHIKEFEKNKGAHIFLKEIENAQRFGVAEIDDKNKVIKVTEKPKRPKSKLAVTGLYLYDSQVFDIVPTLNPSNRGEFEITDVNNEYIKRNQMKATIIKNQWSDAGTFESLYNANNIARKLAMKNQ